MNNSSSTIPKNSTEELQAEILALRLVLTPIVSAILDSPAVVSQYEHLLDRAEEERATAAKGALGLDSVTFKALFSAEAWLKEMSADYLYAKLRAEWRPAGTTLS